MPKRSDRDSRRSRKPRGRSVGTRRERAGTVLIVTEGEKTEPNYFKGVKKDVESAQAGVVDIMVPVIEVKGTGQSTSKLVEQAERILQRSGKVYSEVWIVCDADDFPDLDEAKQRARAEGMGFVWSNRSFELWLLLHFENCEVAYTSRQLFERLDRTLRQKGFGGYDKAREDIYRVLKQNGDFNRAMSRAKLLREMHGEQKVESHPSQCDPCTTVDELVTHLLGFCSV